MRHNIQWESRNTSFIKMAFTLKELGLTNFHFFLDLHDNDLAGVDPHDPNLTTVQKAKIILECTVNPWYYFREVARIEDQGFVGRIKHLPLNKGTLAMIYTSLLGIDHIVRLPRQHYRELTYKHILTYLFLFGASGTVTDLVTPNGEQSTGIINYIRETVMELPLYFSTDYKFVENLRQFKNLRINSSIRKVELPRSVHRAETIARGMSANIQFYYEADFNKNLHTLLYGSKPLFSANRAINKSDKRFSIMISSYVTDTNSSYHIDHLIDNSLYWEDVFYDIDILTLMDLIYKDSPSGFVHIEYDFLQLGKDVVWYNQQCRMLNSDADKINRELLLKR